MEKNYRKGAIGALLDIYEERISALKKMIHDVADRHWTVIVDPYTADENCRSLQSIMTHVVSSAFSYAVYIGQWKGLMVERPERRYLSGTEAYSEALDLAFQFTVSVLQHCSDAELEQQEEARRIQTTWGQAYDIDQMMEHAIVHIQRHCRQIERLKKVFASPLM